ICVVLLIGPVPAPPITNSAFKTALIRRVIGLSKTKLLTRGLLGVLLAPLPVVELLLTFAPRIPSCGSKMLPCRKLTRISFVVPFPAGERNTMDNAWTVGAVISYAVFCLKKKTNACNWDLVLAERLTLESRTKRWLFILSS